MAIEAGQQAAEAIAIVAAQNDLGHEDRRLLAQITYGVLRNRRLLDFWIRPHVEGKLDAVVSNVLRMAYMQAAWLDRVPDYAIVSAAVEQAKRVAPRAQRLVNAVLRRGLDKRPMPDRLAVRYSHPDWIVERWQRRWPLLVEEILRDSNEIPPLTLRVRDPSRRDALVQDLKARGVNATPSPLVPLAIRVSGSLWLEDWPPFAQGEVTVQDESGMLVGYVLDPRPGSRMLDMAAGVGGKASEALEMAPGSRMLAVDLNPERLATLVVNFKRLRLDDRVDVLTRDARSLVGGEWAPFDRIILDAPCSGLGVLRRRADARWKKRPGDLTTLAALQLSLLEAGLTLLKPGGVLVYSTCSVEPEETTAVVDAVLARRPEAHVEPVSPWLPSADLRRLTGPRYLTVRPGQDGLDGFFLARLTRQASDTKGA